MKNQLTGDWEYNDCTP